MPPKRALVLCESPNKRAKIQAICDRLHKDGHIKHPCIVLPTIGHTYDLPQKELGVDEVTFELKMVQTKADVLQKILASARTLGGPVYLATDPDREGEAISFYVQQYLQDKGIKGPFSRIEFNEITLPALKKAFASPRALDMNRVQAQQARRALDRLCGYRISPHLWKELGSYKLAAGRVQSYALDLLVTNSLVRRNFKPEKRYYAVLHLSDGRTARSQPFTDKVQAKKAAAIPLANLTSKFEEVKEEQNPYPPFTTARLLQEAGRRWGYSSQAIMSACQESFAKGRITYHRTDSTTLSWMAVGMMRKELGKTYKLSDKPRTYSGNKGKHAQGAHEAIRPTHFDDHPQTGPVKAPTKVGRTADKTLLYRLIYARAGATQLKAAKWLKQKLTFTASGTDLVWDFHGRILLKKGWMKIDWPMLGEADQKVNPKAMPVKLTVESDLTEPPPPITEAQLIQRMEKDGVGRPSTYASIMAALQRHQYISRQGRVVQPTPVGEGVTVFLRKTFPLLLDAKFTAHMEERLDGIEKGTKKYHKTLSRYNRWITRTLRRQAKRPFTVNCECPECKLVALDMKFPWKGGAPYLSCRSCKKNCSIDFLSDGTIAIFKEEKYKGQCVLCGADLVKKQSQWGPYVQCVNEKCLAVQKGKATITRAEQIERNKQRAKEEKARERREKLREKQGKGKRRGGWGRWTRHKAV